MILTRYLYFKDDVLCSLFFSILNKEKDEALFWAYELYYSGYEEETVEYLLSEKKNLSNKAKEEFDAQKNKIDTFEDVDFDSLNRFLNQSSPEEESPDNSEPSLFSLAWNRIKESLVINPYRHGRR